MGQSKEIGGVARLLRDRRARKGLSQGKLADRIGTSTRQITRWENAPARKMPGSFWREKLGAALDITEPEFLVASGEFAPIRGATVRLLPAVAGDGVEEDSTSIANDPYASLSRDERDAIAYVEDHAGRAGMAARERQMQQKSSRTPEMYAKWCLLIRDEHVRLGGIIILGLPDRDGGSSGLGPVGMALLERDD